MSNGYLGITELQAAELKNVAKMMNGSKFTIFDMMTPANYDWINKDVDTAIRAADFREEKFFKLWLVHHFEFPADNFLYSHRLLPELTKKLAKYSRPEYRHSDRRKTKHHFESLEMMNCAIDSLVDGSIMEQTIKESAAGCYRDYFKD